MAQWIIPCNINLYDVISAFKKMNNIDWKQSNRSIAVNDDVFIYVGKPISAILFRCKVKRVNYANAEIDDSEFVIDGSNYRDYGNYMELELKEEYEASRFSIKVLEANGMRGRIQGPRHVNELDTVLNSYDSNWLDEIESNNINGSEKEIITKVRVNQSIYRERLLRRYNHCCLCGISDTRMLIASHIKPWSECEPKEKLDVDNGLLLCPNHDKLFDGGFITFADDGYIIISNELKKSDRIFLNLTNDMRVEINEKSKDYFQFHRTNVFRG